MFGFGKKKSDKVIETSAVNGAEAPQIDEKELKKMEEKLPSGMKETAERMMSGQFDMNDMLAQLKQIKKMSNFSGLLKMVPGMSGAVSAMKEKIKDGSVDAQIKILEAMTAEERAEPEKIFANAKARIAEQAGCTVRDVEHIIKQYTKMRQQMAMIQRMGGMEAVMEKMKIKERVNWPVTILLLLGLITVGFVLLITVYLVIAGIPAIREIGLFKFLFGKKWASTAATPSYGILPFILTSVYGTAGAIIIGVPVGFLTAVYLAKVANRRVKAVVEMAVSLLAGIPSVVYGLVGMLVLVPWVRDTFNIADGASLFSAIIVLAIMILPSIISVSLTALEAVPPEYEDASLALGATPIETYFKVSVPAAKSGIAAAVVLGVGRAIGEAMAVMMVSGNVANMPKLFQSVRFLTTAVASEMSYSSGLQKQALFSIALVLFLFIMLINALLNSLLKKEKE